MAEILNDDSKHIIPKLANSKSGLDCLVERAIKVYISSYNYKRKLEIKMNPDQEIEIYHITFSCFHRKWLFKSPQLYELFLHQVETVRQRKEIKIYGYVIMPNHVHLILNVSRSNFGKILSSIKRPFSFRALQYLKKQFPDLHELLFYQYGNKSGYRFWQPGRGSVRSIKSQIQFVKTVEYIHNNPEKSELVNRPEDWTWSSCGFWLKGKNNIVQVEEPNI